MKNDLEVLSVRELRNDISAVIRELEEGKAFELQVNRRSAGVLMLVPMGADTDLLRDVAAGRVPVGAPVTIPGEAMGPGFSDTVVTREQAVRWLAAVSNALATGRI